MSTEITRRTFATTVRILDEAKGIAEYIASNETIDAYREIVAVDGWMFDNFRKNAPFVDSHNYGSVGNVLGRVLEWKVAPVDGKPALIERVQWAKDIPNTLAEWGWKMTVGGFLKAVSVGFWPVSFVSKWDADKTRWQAELNKRGLHEEDGVSVIYLKQQQVELSACVIGANPDAVARAYKAGAISDENLDAMQKFRDRIDAERTQAEAKQRLVASGASKRGNAAAFAIAARATAISVTR